MALTNNFALHIVLFKIIISLSSEIYYNFKCIICHNYRPPMYHNRLPALMDMFI